MLSKGRGAAGAALTMVLAACAGGEPRAAPPPMAVPQPEPVSAAAPPRAAADERVTPSYDEVGIASWYGEELAGKATASGEPYDPSGYTAAHRTLPLGSYVEVTELDRGKTIIVRINDRGPFHDNRLIDLSRGAAGVLAITGPRAVRVRRIQASVADRAHLAGGRGPLVRLDAPDIMLSALRKRAPGYRAESGPASVALPPSSAMGEGAAAPVAALKPPRNPAPVKPAPSKPALVRPTQASPGGMAVPAAPATAPTPSQSAAGSYVVQVAAFSSEPRAQALAKRLGGRAESAGRLWRVRLGPFKDRAEAGSARARAAAQGFGDARVEPAN